MWWHQLTCLAPSHMQLRHSGGAHAALLAVAIEAILADCCCNARAQAALLDADILARSTANFSSPSVGSDQVGPECRLSCALSRLVRLGEPTTLPLLHRLRREAVPAAA